jgi:hypothetical protein
MTRTRIRIITVGLIIASAITFAIGAAVERNGDHKDARPPTTVTAQGSGGHGEEVDADGGPAPAAPDNDGKAPGTTEQTGAEADQHSEISLGINPESTPLVLAAVVGLLVLAGALLVVGSPLLAALIGLGMAAFAVLDVREVVHQFGESHSSLAVLAIVVAVLHLLAAGGAIITARTAAHARPA